MKSKHLRPKPKMAICLNFLKYCPKIYSPYHCLYDGKLKRQKDKNNESKQLFMQVKEVKLSALINVHPWTVKLQGEL